MKKKLSLVLISSVFITSAAYADFGFSEPSDFTGEAFFSTGVPVVNSKASSNRSDSHTMPPIKKLRIKLKNRKFEKQQQNLQLAPTMQGDAYVGEIDTSDFVSKEIEEKFEDVNLTEEKSVKKEKTKKKLFNKKEKVSQEPSENIILDCENVDYDAPNYTIKAIGKVSVVFVKQGTTVKADTITFDRLNNTIKAEGHVCILKGTHKVTGDYIFVDLNEENALIENPVTRTATIEMRAKKGNVYGDKIVQEDGSISIKDSYPIVFSSGRRGPRLERMMVPKTRTLTDEMESGAIKVKAKDIKITQRGEMEAVTVKKLRVFRGDKTILKHPSLSLYTNKNHDYVETGSWEIGSYRGLGLYTGPGIIVPLPKGSVLKAIPMLNYKSGFGYGAVGRFSSGTNNTMAGYGTANDKLILYGRQRLDDKLYLQYGVNSYMDEWFLGRRRPKYGVSVAYKDQYSTNNFLLKGKHAAFMHRLEAGYYHDLDFDTHYEKLRGSQIGTTRFKYMMQGVQNIFEYKDEEKLKALSLGVVGQMSSAVYGTGDTQVMGRVGPMLHTQYRRWMQDVGFMFTAYDDHTPLRVFDSYRYGKQNLIVRESFRVNRLLTLSWLGSMTLTNDSPNGKDFQENAFYVSVGPDDFKFNVGYDFIRENLYCTISVMMDAKGTHVEYDKLEIKQTKKAPEREKLVDKTIHLAPTSQVLQRAVVQNMKEVEDVL